MSQNKSMNQTSPQPGMGPKPGGPMGHLYQEKITLKDAKGSILRLLDYIGSQKAVLILTLVLCTFTTIVNIYGTRLNGSIMDDFIITKDLKGLAWVCLVLGGLYLLSTITSLFQNIIMVKLSQRTSAKIRKDLFDTIQTLPLRYFDTHSSGDMMSRLTNDVDNINMTLSQSLVQFVSGIVNIVGMLIAMLLLSPLLTLIGLLTTPLMFFITKSLVKKTQPYFKSQQKELGRLNGYIEEMVSGQKVTLLFSAEKQVYDEFQEINTRLTKSASIAQSVSGFMGPINNFINNLTYLIVAVAGAILVVSTRGAAHPITVGIVFSFILYMRNFTRPINEILNIFNSIQSTLAGAERVFEIMDETPEKDMEGARDTDKFIGEVTLADVDFSYVPDKPILKKASIHAKQGDTVAIVGPTGAGKTTIINLLTKFYDINGGSILIDGKNINEISRKSLRNHISMVLQDTYLFSQSIKDNIRYGDLSADDKEVINAAQMANAHHFIMQLPDGYDTILSDNGSNLSQGQRQLLAIARAILAKSSILILDEATSSIDTQTEVEIQKAMLSLMEGKTTFIIAHRLSTIRGADQILVLKDGEIIENGTHITLLEKEGFYSYLYHSQFTS